MAGRKPVQPPAETPENPSALANVGARRKQLQDAIATINGLKAQGDVKREEASGYNKQISDIFRKLKSDLGMDRKNLEFIMGVVALEDEDERDKVTDQLREAYESLAPGAQADFLGVLGGDTDEAASFSPTEITAARERGRAAGTKGRNREPTPFDEPHRRKLRDAYIEGWDEQQAEAVAKLGGAKDNPESPQFQA